MDATKRATDNRQNSIASRDIRRRLWEISEVDAIQYRRAFHRAFEFRHGSKGLAVEMKPSMNWAELRGERRSLVPDDVADRYDPEIHAGPYFSFSFLLLGRLVLDEFIGPTSACADIELKQRFMAFSRGYGTISNENSTVPIWETSSIDLFLDRVEQELVTAIKDIH